METLGFITHELKSPMAASQQMLALVLDGTLDHDHERKQDFLHRIERALDQSQDMIKNYLDMTRVERGELAIQMRTLDLCSDVVNPVAERVGIRYRAILIDIHRRS
jgi:K+-sensing histidine kinase KdpD